jgi:hypothetical protein
VGLTSAASVARTIFFGLVLAATGLAQDVLAPPRIPLHEGPRVGDTLERTTEQRGATSVERTTIVGREGQDFVIERTGPAWPGAALRLVVDAAGRTRSAQLGPVTGAAAGELRPIAVADADVGSDDEGELAAGEEELKTAAGTFACTRRVLERSEPLPQKNTRWLVASGPRKGLLVRQRTEVAGRTTELELIGLEETTVKVGDVEVPCLHLTRRALLDGVPQVTTEEWVAVQPLLFQETLIRLDNGLGSARITAIAHDGKSAFPPQKPQ